MTEKEFYSRHDKWFIGKEGVLNKTQRGYFKGRFPVSINAGEVCTVLEMDNEGNYTRGKGFYVQFKNLDIPRVFMDYRDVDIDFEKQSPEALFPDLGLHEELYLDNPTYHNGLVSVRRVPSGWLYNYIRSDEVTHSVFVPEN